MNKRNFPIRNKIVGLVLIAMVPITVVAIYLVCLLFNYNRAYEKLVSNMTIANDYNLEFKDQVDESLYKLAVGAITFDTIDQDETLANPYDVIRQMKSVFERLMEITQDRNSRNWLQSLMRNIDTLEDRVDDLRSNLAVGGRYDRNMELLDNNIYILTELIQDDIQFYIYYQAKSMENLKDNLYHQVQMTMLVSIVILCMLIAFVSILAMVIGRSIIHPVRTLDRATRKIAEGDFSVQTDIHSHDELEDLSRSINDMTTRLKIMMDEIKEDERKMRHAELRLLQEQINPHFLYNTLDTIVWLIEGNDSDKAVEMVVTLSNFFRLVLSKGKEYISLREEEQHIRSYLEIQQFRYRDILDYSIDISSELYQYKILKLTLQPLVENALYHGIKYKRAKGTILVEGIYKDGYMHLVVEDDGVGMDEEELAKLQSEISKPCKETESGFGLANVNERIRMNFGQQYGMEITSQKGIGTRVEITLPAIELS